MCSLVVENYMNILVIGDPVLNKVEELAEFDTTMTSVAFTNHFAASCVKCCEKGKGMESSVVMGPMLDLSRPQRQKRLSTVERLYLAARSKMGRKSRCSGGAPVRPGRRPD